MALVLVICLLFVGLGLVFVPRAGIQDDEALFTVPIYQNYFQFSIRPFGHDIPLMIMSYVGTLKTLLYLPILDLFPAGRLFRASADGPRRSNNNIYFLSFS